VMFEPRVALASLSGRSDASWAQRVQEYVGAAFLGGIALDGPTRAAARQMVARDRTEFLPDDPFAFVDAQLAQLSETPLRPGFNVRAASPEPVRRAAEICASHEAIVEINAHCRQEEICATGCGEALLRDGQRLAAYVRAAATTDATVSVKVRTELDGVDLPEVARQIDSAGADAIHVDAMDSESVVGEVVDARDLFVVANNGVRDEATVREYLRYGADAVSVGRASDDPDTLAAVADATADWFKGGDEQRTATETGGVDA
jgi:TIM-barrel protein